MLEYDEAPSEDKGFDKAGRQSTPREKSKIFHAGTPSASVLPEGNIRMKNKEKAPFSRGAYYVVRNPQNYPTETFFGGDPARGAFDAVVRPTLSYSLRAIFG